MDLSTIYFAHFSGCRDERQKQDERLRYDQKRPQPLKIDSKRERKGRLLTLHSSHLLENDFKLHRLILAKINIS